MGLAGLCHRPFAEDCTAQNAGDRGVAPPRRSTPGSPSSSRLALASLPQPELEVRSLRNAARQYPCARPSVLSPRAPRDVIKIAPHRHDANWAVQVPAGRPKWTETLRVRRRGPATRPAIRPRIRTAARLLAAVWFSSLLAAQVVTSPGPEYSE